MIKLLLCEYDKVVIVWIWQSCYCVNMIKLLLCEYDKVVIVWIWQSCYCVKEIKKQVDILRGTECDCSSYAFFSFCLRFFFFSFSFFFFLILILLFNTFYFVLLRKNNADSKKKKKKKDSKATRKSRKGRRCILGSPVSGVTGYSGQWLALYPGYSIAFRGHRFTWGDANCCPYGHLLASRGEYL